MKHSSGPSEMYATPRVAGIPVASPVTTRLAGVLVAMSVLLLPMQLAMGAASFAATSLMLHAITRVGLAFGIVLGVRGARWAALAVSLAPSALVVVRVGHHPLDIDAALVHALFAAGLSLILVGRPGPLRTGLAIAACLFAVAVSLMFFPMPARSLIPPGELERAACAKELARLEDALSHGFALPARESSQTTQHLIAALSAASTTSASSVVLGEAVSEATFWCPPVSRAIDAWTSQTPDDQRSTSGLGRAILPGARECFCQGLDIPLVSYVVTNP